MSEQLFRKNLIATGRVTAEVIGRVERELLDGELIEQALERLGLIVLADVYSALAKSLHVPLVDLSRYTPSPLARRLIPDWVSLRDGVVPLKCDDSSLKLAMICPNDLQAMENAAFASDRRILPVLAPREQLLDLQTRLFAPETDQERAPAVTLTNKILREAFVAGASDIHIEPNEDGTEVRARIDGELHEIETIPAELSSTVVGRIKVLASLDLAKRYEPQDGSFSVKLSTRRFDVRVSTIPVPHGEKVVMRLLDPATSNVRLGDLGILKDTEQSLDTLLKRPQGLIIVTGPTGSGKSTTLCSILNSLKEGGRSNLVSIENPIEYQIAGVNQIQINPRQNMTFASVLRSILRQDPDVISVGEIRDQETAVIAHHAAETGHLVFSTLHTNDAPTAVTRLVDLGVEPFVVSSSLTAVLAQRLVRRTCRRCAKPVEPSVEDLAALRILKLEKDAKLHRGQGCSRCANTGYRGRIAVNELLVINMDLRNLIAHGASAEDLYDCARKHGFRTMWEVGLILVAQGLTTLDEIKRRVPPTEVSAGSGTPPPMLQAREAVPRVRVGVPRILIADDDPVILRVVAKALEPLEAELFTVNNGEAAVHKARELNPALVITDLDMPKQNGFQVTEALRLDESTAAIPIIILTGNDTEQAEVAGIECGADDFLTKPFSPRALLARVKAVIRRTELDAGIRR